jgi:hypothetical protein
LAIFQVVRGVVSNRQKATFARHLKIFHFRLMVGTVLRVVYSKSSWSPHQNSPLHHQTINAANEHDLALCVHCLLCLLL